MTEKVIPESWIKRPRDFFEEAISNNISFNTKFIFSPDVLDTIFC
jgi:hypothetical protein